MDKITLKKDFNDKPYNFIVTDITQEKLGEFFITSYKGVYETDGDVKCELKITRRKSND